MEGVTDNSPHQTDFEGVQVQWLNGFRESQPDDFFREEEQT